MQMSNKKRWSVLLLGMILLFANPVFSEEEVENPGEISSSDILDAAMDGASNANGFISGQCFYMVWGGPSVCPPKGGVCMKTKNHITHHQPDFVVCSHGISGACVWKDVRDMNKSLKQAGEGVIGGVVGAKLPLTASATSKASLGGMDAPFKDVGVWGSPAIPVSSFIVRMGSPIIQDPCPSQATLMLPYYSTEMDPAWRISLLGPVQMLIESFYGLAEGALARRGTWGRLFPIKGEVPINTNAGLTAALTSFRAAFIATGALNPRLIGDKKKLPFVLTGAVGRVAPNTLAMQNGKCPFVGAKTPPFNPECQTFVTENSKTPDNDKVGLWQLIYPTETEEGGESSNGGGSSSGGGAGNGDGLPEAGFIDSSEDLQKTLLDVKQDEEDQAENFAFVLWRCYKCCERPLEAGNNWEFIESVIFEEGGLQGRS